MLKTKSWYVQIGRRKNARSEKKKSGCEKKKRKRERRKKSGKPD
jgi:hypothetical protein